jgi:hypothetical protein
LVLKQLLKRKSEAVRARKNGLKKQKLADRSVRPSERRS